MGDNITGKPRQTVFFLGGFPMYREQCQAAFDKLNAFDLGLLPPTEIIFKGK